MNSTLPVPAVISEIHHLSADTTLFMLTTESTHPVASAFLPGQFLELSLPGVGEIPISYCGFPSKRGYIELCIRHVGQVTTALKASSPGDFVGVRGPFGKGFPLSAYAGQDLLLIAGGVGMAPLRSLLAAVLKKRDQCGRITLLYGAREIAALLFLDELQKLQKSNGIELHLTVNHYGHCLNGPPDCRTALLPALLDQIVITPSRTCAAICGPPQVYPLLVSGLHLLGMTDDRIHLSLERRMKCGVGHCGHCAVGNFLCCVDGPVFSYADISAIEGALS